MIFPISETLLSASSSLVAKATLGTALALIAARLARRSRASLRHALLAAAFGVLLVLPIASVVARPVRIVVPIAAQKPAVPPPFAGTFHANTGIAPAEAGVGVRPRLSASDLLLSGWIAGLVLFLLPVAMGLWQVRSLRLSALPWPRGQSIAERLALDAGIHRRTEVLLHEGLAGPMTCGVMRPAIMLSPDAQTWAAGDLNRAIAHELEHVRRRDWVTHCLARTVCAVYWFHPLVWIAWRKLVLEAERSCDDAVLRHSEATDYADQLVELAQRLSMVAKSPLLAMANRADLATRVHAVLDKRQRRGRAGILPMALASTAAAVLVLTMSPLRMVAAPQFAGTNIRANLSVNTMLVMVNVVVSDQNGRTIQGLGAKDFNVAEDGVAQTISVFESQMLASTAPGVRDYYTLGFYTANQSENGEFRKIQIALSGNTQAKLDYRQGYYASIRVDRSGLGSGVSNSAGLEVTPPILLHKRSPEYSEEARKAKYQGTAVLDVTVDANGDPVNIKVLRSLGLGLDEKAIEAVKDWKFRPGTKNGSAIDVQAQVEVNFRLW